MSVHKFSTVRVPTRACAAAAVCAITLAGCGSTHTVTVTRTVTAQAAAAPAPSSRSFSGNGVEMVGTITVGHDSTLRWTCSGTCATFSVYSLGPSTPGPIMLAAHDQHSGTDAVSAGSYQRVQVASDGDWAFTISPG